MFSLGYFAATTGFEDQCLCTSKFLLIKEMD